jgi:hypothetical protein
MIKSTIKSLKEVNVQTNIKPNWLERIIIEAIEKNWCLKAGCTTCGAMKFRKRLSGYNKDGWDWKLYRVHLKIRDRFSNIHEALSEIKLPKDENTRENYKKVIKLIKSDLKLLQLSKAIA